MKRRNFLKGVVGLAAVPVVGVVAAKAVSNPNIIIESKASLAARYSDSLAVRLTREKVLAAEARLFGDDVAGVLMTPGHIEPISNERFYGKPVIDQPDARVAHTDLNRAMNKILDNMALAT